jgi:hypothetical protein
MSFEKEIFHHHASFDSIHPNIDNVPYLTVYIKCRSRKVLSARALPACRNNVRLGFEALILDLSIVLNMKEERRTKAFDSEISLRIHHFFEARCHND